jgi:hypothetical protein
VTDNKIENEPKTPPHLLQLPPVNRWVHYTSAGSADGKFPSVCRAALVTEVPAPESEAAAYGIVGLMVANPTGLHFRPIVDGGAAYDPEKGPYTWHWPERG